MIQLIDVSKVFNIQKDSKTTQFTAVHPTTLCVQQGEIFGIIGSSGAGKSTLIRCINLLERPTTGKVMLSGQDLTALSERELVEARRHIGMIFQHFNLLHSRTVFDNIALPLELSQTPKNTIHQKVSRLIELVGLNGKEHVYPANLSGGQKQRVAIARALACDPKVLLCDEATSALDPATTQAILSLLKKINRKLGITILLITHEMDVVKQICDKVAVMDLGVVVESGKVSELFANPQTELAKQFIGSTFHVRLPQAYLSKLSQTPTPMQTYPVVKFGFTGNSVDMPLFSQATKQYGVEFNILTSQMDYVGEVKFGFTIAEMIGDVDKTQQARKFLYENGVTAEVLGYVA
ncbi:methionine ABC transporter ATP-binding protein MetN [Moraxella nasovis]|uniref:methionine ABC transporter ATP-binding protein MetN n=1 Tax=Moraxella nasovis TaxID=2904121 RepID=UPI001F618480|nr:methionine ABC transporter ATP-binding protein MetN [Moraxella nasovis]UNU74005.1 methionine ABC transporter ATP-binding protein MetN [Moraxella nasovis]